MATREFVALVKHDCPTCDLVLPALEAAGVRLVSQSGREETAEQARRVGLRGVPELDEDLALSARFDPDAVPAVLLLEDGEERDRLEGLRRSRLAELLGVEEASLGALPEFQPGCGAVNRDPEVAARLAARAARASGRLRSRSVALGALEDPIEALHERGWTDGLPVVPPTPERVVRMLDHTSRDAQEVVGVVPPYGAEATVEKVAINAVMAGCPDEVFPVVLAAVEAACVEAFAWHGLMATTHPAGPLVIVSGPLVERLGFHTGGNVLGQGARANVTVGRALQLVGRNVGGARPGDVDRATHRQMGKVGACLPERADGSPFAPLCEDLGLPAGSTGVTVVAAEAPRLILDQLARTPEELCVSLAGALLAIGHPKMVLAFDGTLCVGPEHGRIFREAGWDRARVQSELFERCRTPAGALVRGAGGSAEGIDPQWVSDPEQPVQKFAAAERILVVHAGGDAGLFSMVLGGWAAGEIGSAPQTRAVDPWL